MSEVLYDIDVGEDLVRRDIEHVLRTALFNWRPHQPNLEPNISASNTPLVLLGEASRLRYDWQRITAECQRHLRNVGLMILVRSERDELAVPDLVARCGAQLIFFECKLSRPSEPSELWSKRLAEACQRLTERMSPGLIRAAAYADGILLVEFGDGLRRALTWSDLPFALHTPQLDPATARISEDFDAVVVDDAMGGEFDVDGLALRSIADRQTRRAIDAEASATRKRFGERLRMLRESLSQTQEDLAKRSGIAQPTISRIESGDREPRLSTLRGYATGLGLSVEQLLARLDESTSSHT